MSSAVSPSTPLISTPPAPPQFDASDRNMSINRAVDIAAEYNGRTINWIGDNCANRSCAVTTFIIAASTGVGAGFGAIIGEAGWGATGGCVASLFFSCIYQRNRG